MVVQQRNEVGRNRILYLLTVVLAASVIAGIAFEYGESSEAVRLVLIVLGACSLTAIALAVVQLIGYPKRSQALLFHLEDRMIIATNARHEGYKLRFLRDILGDSVGSFSDDERLHWKTLEADGYYPSLYIRSPKKLLMLRLCTMIFDDVFVADRNDRWEHHDASSTSEPTYSNRQMPPLKAWKGSSKISA
jgi:hypothetical protein